MGFMDKVKGMVFEEESVQQQVQPAPVASQTYAVPMTASAGVGVVMSAPSLGEEGEKIYQRLLAATSFDNTEVFATLHRFLDPLAAIPMDDTTRFKAALVQARQHEGMGPEKVLGTFEGLKVALSNEQKSFEASVQKQDQEVAAKSDKMALINSQIAAKQQEIANLQNELATASSELIDTQGKVQRAKSQFALAAQRRAGEIEQEKTKYANFMKGL